MGPANIYLCRPVDISSSQIAWIIFIQNNVSFLFRINGDGTLLQVIGFGALNLSFSTEFSYINVISDTEFLFIQDLSLINGNMSVGPKTGTDLSIARISTNLTVQFNLMIDYKNGVDYGLNSLVDSNGTCYSLLLSVSNGYLLSIFPTDMSQIVTEKIMQNSYLLSASSITTLNYLFYCSLFRNLNNRDQNYNFILSIICQISLNQIKILHFNMTSTSFTSTSVININKDFNVLLYESYNTTMIYVSGYLSGSAFIYIGAYDTLSKTVRIMYSSNDAVLSISAFDQNIYIITGTTYNYFINLMTISKSDIGLNISGSCNSFQDARDLNFTISDEDPSFQVFNISDVNIMLYTKYVLVFNITQTPFPIFDQDITSLFWPQTKYYGISSICQPSGPILSNTQINWTLSESSLSLDITPFTNCQGIPINITSVRTSDLDSSLFTVNGSIVTVNSGYGPQNALRRLDTSNLSTKVSINKTIVIFIDGETNTFTPITAEGTFAINIQNNPPNFINSINLLKAKITNGLNLAFIYSSFCTSNLTSIILRDNEQDSLYLLFSINTTNYVQNLINLDTQNCEFDLFVDTSSFDPGYYSIKIILWDIFHEQNPIEETINLEVFYFEPPSFAVDLPATLNIPICVQTVFDLPQIINDDGGLPIIKLKPQKSWTTIQDMSIIFNPTYADLGVQNLAIELSNKSVLTNNYNLSIAVIDNFKYNPVKIDNITVYYPRAKEFSISKLLSMLVNHATSVNIKENSEDVEWANYVAGDQSILISNYSQNNYGVHNLTISIYDYCFRKTFESFIIVEITHQHPPVATGSISNITVYQGQENIRINLQNDLFYDKEDNFDITINCCDNVRISSNISFENISDSSSSSVLGVQINKDFIGECPSKLIAVDSLLQTASIEFYIIALKCPQAHCLYCNGPNNIDCTTCVSGFVVDPKTGDCRIANVFFDCWIIIFFAIVVLLMTISTNHDLNASYILLESITYYWMLFFVFVNRENDIKSYFDSILLIITHFNYLVFPLFTWIVPINSQTGITDTLFENIKYLIIIYDSYILCFIILK